MSHNREVQQLEIDLYRVKKYYAAQRTDCSHNNCVHTVKAINKDR